MKSLRAATLVLPLALGACASAADVTGLATQQELQQVRSELTIAEQNALRARRDAEAAIADAQKRDGDRERRLNALTDRLNGVAAALAALTERLDDLSGRLEAVSRQARGQAGPAIPPATRPLAPSAAAPAAPPTAAPAAPATASPSVAATTPPAMPPTAAPAPTTPGTAVLAPTMPPTAGPAPVMPAPVAPAPPAAAVPPVAPQPTSRPATNALQPQDIYQAAYLDYSKGSYALAIAGFREFLRRFPDQPLAGAAQYWIGEANFSMARGYMNAGQADKANEALEQAVQEFRKVLASYPRSDKAPTAIYKEALALFDLKQPGQAQSRLQYLVDTFPQSEESALARERLAALKPR
jgi:tol-pal system protein YbgF